VELCVMLCRQYDLTEEDIICHSEGGKKGIASNHGDVMHWFPKHGESMNSFRTAVRAALNKKGETSTVPSGIAVGDVVEVKSSASKYYPDGATIPAWVKTGSYHKVTQVLSNGRPVIKGGKTCVLLGKKVDKKKGKESAGIMSWIDVGALNIVKSSKPPDNQKLYRVQVGAFSNKGNAEALLKKLKSAGFTDAFIK